MIKYEIINVNVYCQTFDYYILLIYAVTVDTYKLFTWSRHL